jgi:hypothetical protein
MLVCDLLPIAEVARLIGSNVPECGTQPGPCIQHQRGRRRCHEARAGELRDPLDLVLDDKPVLGE